MKFLDRKEFLDQLETKSENHLKKAIKVFQNLPADELLKASPSGGWSIAECLEHLNSYGNYYHPRIKKALERQQKETVSIDFKPGFIGRYFVQMIEPTTGTKKYKAAKSHVPPKNLDAHKVVANFIEQQEELLSFLRKSRQINLNNGRISVSIFKWIKLSFGETLHFLIAHNERHILQATRNLP